MKIISAKYQILTPINGMEMLKSIEYIARTCYKSEDSITYISAVKMFESLIRSGHEAMLEHQIISVKFIVDRGLSHELVRHRMASYAQESTRYCNYSKDKFGNELTFIKPCFWEQLSDNIEDNYALGEWEAAMADAEMHYFNLIENGATPEQARTVLPNSIKTEVVMTANLREWRHFFKLRVLGTTGKPHPQMWEVAAPLLAEFKALIPVVFDDLVQEEKYESVNSL